MKRVYFLTVPIDLIDEGDFKEAVIGDSYQKGMHRVVFLTVWDILKARCSTQYRAFLHDSQWCIPTSKSVMRGLHFLNLPDGVLRSPCDVIIRFLNAVDEHYKSVYLFGGKKNVLIQAEKNIHSTFVNTHIVGRFFGYYPKHLEEKIITAIQKAHPRLVILSRGITGGQKWSYKKKDQLPSGIFIYSRDIFDIFANKKKRISEKRFQKGFMLTGVLKNPLKILLIFPFCWYLCLLVFYKLFRTTPAHTVNTGTNDL